MSEEYLSRIDLEVDGKSIDDFDGFTEDEVEHHRPVNLMKITGFTKVTQRYGCKVSYVIPASGEFDWSNVEDGRLTIEFENGKRITFTGVYLIKIGEMTVDGEKAATRSIELGASGRMEE